MSNNLQQSNTPSATASVKMGPFRLLDAWRGIAALAVVFYHWAGLAEFRTPELKTDPLHVFSHYGWLGVQVFFVISGYCIAAAAAAILRRGEGLKEYLWARARRIYPTYWAALALSLGFVAAGAWLASRGLMKSNIFSETNVLTQGPLYILSNLTLTMTPLHQSILLSVAWTLCYEISFYAIIGVALAIALRTRRAEVMLPLLHGLTVAMLAGLIISPRSLPFPLELWPQFGLGVMVYDVLSRPGQRVPRLWLAVALTLLAIFLLTQDVFIGAAFVASRISFGTAGVFAVFLLLAYPHDKKWSALPWVDLLGKVGVFSYSLYLTHSLSVRVVNQLVQMAHIPNSLHYLTFVLAVAIAVGVAYVFYRLFEKPLLDKKKATRPAASDAGTVSPAATPAPVIPAATPSVSPTSAIPTGVAE